jgi:hypothetical protein
MEAKYINTGEVPEVIEKQINDVIAYCKKNELINDNNISDGWHTFDQLYEIRKAYNVALFNEWNTENQHQAEARELHNSNAFSEDRYEFVPKYNVHKSRKHFDGEECFGGGWFIVVAVLPTGQISNHYKMEDWDLFKIPETEKALFEFDGHTTEDVINRLKSLK